MRRLGDSWQHDLQRADPRRAIRAYRTAPSLNPNSAQAWWGLASVYEMKVSQIPHAKAMLHAKRAYPLSADVRGDMQTFLLMAGEVDPASVKPVKP